MGRTALSRAAGGREFPSLEVTLGFVRACGGDVEEWRARWQRARAAHLTEAPGVGPGTDETVTPAAPAVAPQAWMVPWSVPWLRNPHFVGRLPELAALRAGWSGDRNLPQVLLGLPGVGKTQLAVEYAYRHAGDYDLVWWLPAEQPASLLATLASLADRLEIGVRGDAEGSASAAVAVLAEGSRFPRWLVVLDNAEEPADLHGLLSAAARTTGGNLLITARDPAWSSLAVPLELCELPERDAVALLSARAPRLTAREANRVAEAVGYLPLALESAGSWLAETATPVDSYLEHLRSRVRDVLSRNPPPGHVSVAATFTEVLMAIDDPAAATLTLLWAQFGPRPIPVSLIHPGVASMLPPPLDTVAQDPLAYRDLVRHLARASVIRPLQDDTVMMHRLARAIFQEATPAGQRSVLLDAARHLLAAAHPEHRTAPSGWRAYGGLYPHAVATDLVDFPTAAARDLVLWLVWSLRAAGDYTNSRRLAEHAHRRWTTTLGAGHLDSMLAAANLAATMWAQNQPEEAQQVLTFRRMRHRGVSLERSRSTPEPGEDEELLTSVRRIHGADHPHAITVTAQIAATYFVEHDYEPARRYFEDVRERGSRVLGQDHPHIIRATNYLGAILLAQGDLAAARHLLEDNLDQALRTLGDNHPDTMRTTVNLVAVWQARGDGRARDHAIDSLPRAVRKLGESHPDIAATSYPDDSPRSPSDS
ncbi:FxSxx-COOH system tetratricopeptide repeat protein [Frankia sp. Cpl3]|nr:FxSxx-COOH system tetratricopeptide repeat protein [Frankia sp. Cpl3]